MKVMVYGTESCPFCTKAKNLAERYGLDYDYIIVDSTEKKVKFRELFPDAKTVPQIMMGDRYIGGYNEFATEIESTIGGYGQGEF